MKSLALLLAPALALLLGACVETAPVAYPGVYSVGSYMPVMPQPGYPSASPQVQQVSAMDAPMAGYMDLASRRTYPITAGPPKGLYVTGTLFRGGSVFAANSQILGQGPMGQFAAINAARNAQLTAGWLELQTGQFSPRDAGRPPQTPFVEGFMDALGRFTPASLRVIY